MGRDPVLGEIGRSTGGPGGERALGPVPVGGFLGRWKVVEVLGRGGMGVVYRAECEDRTAALKVVHPHLLDRPEFVRRFHLEAETGARVRHPNVVRTYGVETAEVQGHVVHYLVMELVRGRTLAALQEELGRLPEGLLRDLAAGVAAGLAAIHEAGIIHRDLKPENVLVTEKHEIKIMDLGVARLAGEELRLSRTGQFIGSLLFAAPEQLGDRAGQVTPAIDLYAFGLMLYQLAAGRHPFDASSVAEVVNAHLHETPAPLSALVPECTPFLQAVTETLLAKDPAARFESARALAETFELGEASPWWRAKAASLGRTPRRAGRSTGVGPLLGRARELRELTEAARGARAGVGSTVLLVGEPGIGKSRLAETFVEAAAAESGDALVGAVPRGEGESPFAATRAILAEGCAEGLERGALRLLPGRAMEACALAATLSDAPVPGAETLPADEAAALAVEVICALAKERPRVVVMEDVDRAGEGDLAVARGLASRASGLPLFFLVTAAEPVEPALRASLADAGGAREVTLGRLGPEDMRSLLDAIVGDDRTARALAAELLPRAGGSPQVLERLVDGLRACGAVKRSTAGGLELTGVAIPQDLPRSVADLVEARLRRVPAAAREVLEAASVQGTTFDVRVLAAVLEQPQLAVLEALVPVAREPRLIRGEGRERRFDPPLVQEVLWGRLPASRRAALHARTAEALLSAGDAAEGGRRSGRDVAHAAGHFLLAGMPARAAEHLIPALDGLLALRRNGEAMELTRLALATGDALDAGLRAGVLLRRARLLELSGRREEERAALESAIDAVAAAGKAAPVELLEAYGGCLAALGDRRRAEEVFREQLQAAETAGNEPAEAMAQGVLARIALARGDVAAARAGAERSLLLSRSAGQSSQEATALGILAAVFERGGKPDLAIAHQTRRLAMASRLFDPRQASEAHGALARLALRRGRLREAQVHLDRQLATASEIGQKRGESRARHGFGRLALARGRPAEAAAAFREAMGAARVSGSTAEEAAAAVDLARALLYLGDRPAATAVLLRALSLAERAQDADVLSIVRILCGLAAEWRGDGEESAAWCREALLAGKALGGYPEVLAWLGVARACAVMGRLERMTEPLDRAAGIAARLGWPGPLTVAVALRATLPGGDPARAVAMLAEHGESLAWVERIEVHVALAKATGDPWHLGEGLRALEAAQADLTPGERRRMDDGFAFARALRAGAPEAALGGDR